MVNLVPAKTRSHLKEIRQLFEEYAEWLGFDLCFQGFEEELGRLPGDYAPPYGCLMLALSKSQTAGCVALRKIDKTTCEMKRLYVRPAFRGKGIGRKLTAVIIEHARQIGYTHMRLDTVPWMKEAIALYRSFGFRQIRPYRHNPIAGAIYMELDLPAG